MAFDKFNAYLKGDFHPDGWISPWRRRLENQFEPVVVVAKVVHIRKPATKYSACDVEIWDKAKSGYRKQCYAAKVRKIERRKCGTCRRELGRVNKSGYCNRHKWSRLEAALNCPKCGLPLSSDHTHRTYEEHDACRSAAPIPLVSPASTKEEK